MSKVLWFDCETTGVDPKNCAIVQLAGMIEIKGNIVEDFNFKIKPHEGALITDEALKVNGMTMEQLETFADHQTVYLALVATICRYVDKYNPSDKLVLAGYNVGFDEQFLREFFLRNKDKYFGSLFAWPKIDVAHCVAEEYVKGLRLLNFKLGTLCKQYGIPLNAHEAMGDIVATRKLYYTLKSGV